MKEPYIEGLAPHDDPESCVVDRKGAVEALTGVCAGRVLSPENVRREGRRSEEMRKATRLRAYTPARNRLPGVGDPLHVQNHQAREPGDPRVARHDGVVGRDGNAEAASRRCTNRGSLTAPYYRRSTGTKLPWQRRTVWREGGGPRETRPSETHAGRSAGGAL